MILRTRKLSAVLLLSDLMWHCSGPAFGQDRFEINTQVCLYSNRLEIHATLARSAMALLVAEEGRELADLATPSGFEAELPRLRHAAANFFQLTAWSRPPAMLETNVTSRAEYHMKLRLVYPLPAQDPLRIDAVGLKRLPTDQGYGASVIVQDMVNNKVLGQKLLTATDSTMEVTLLNAPDEAPTGTPQSRPASVSNQMAPTDAETSSLQTNATNRYLLVFVAIALVVLLGGWRLMVRFRSGQ